MSTSGSSCEDPVGNQVIHGGTKGRRLDTNWTYQSKMTDKPGIHKHLPIRQVLFLAQKGAAPKERLVQLSGV